MGGNIERQTVQMEQRRWQQESVTATAHKLARIVCHLLATKQPYTEEVIQRGDTQAKSRAENRLRQQAAALGFRLLPAINTTR